MIEVFVRERIEAPSGLFMVDMTDDTDGPVTRIQRFVWPDELDQYPVGRKFVISPDSLP